jgi:hypothetical protein
VPWPYLILAACVIGSCSIGPSSDHPPMLVLHYENQQEFETAAVQAGDYCRENFGNTAHTSDKWMGVAGDATFACSP